MSALPSSDPAQRTALVTGGGRRIGRAIAEDLALRGWRVAIHCNTSKNEAEEVAQGIRDAGGEAAVFAADLVDIEAVEGLLPSVTGALGPVTLLVNNASVFWDDAAESLNAEIWDKQLAINLRAPIFLTRDFARLLPQGVEGLVVNIVDQRVLKPDAEFVSYTISKSALWTATQTLAQALAPDVRVNAIGPGPTLPNPHDGEAGFEREIAQETLLGRSVDLADFGRTIRYLWQTRSLTGQFIALDSGQHLT
ncbi:SDR family oxidoreductase [Afifella marina]|uniref:NAD(P)-dependent dehydrogenase, short-chain alcohol dehydrogenase family n=1 Tax=Afifella marina DSM 2698 TaxID=1120955 RepID=A0A1G5P1T8_AFIMA|nr:SDR family oxidoreductase [Afifella marina]MBK1624246.1 short chain dehydrogenase [Afifella marina DSM 2698]MBK1627979.1 short chain dehydrogenase [Afifella marina]MBK5918173.1 short chain dehydrogenase [Afifella marina]RAI19219.1 short chain dehydrogenase [Afifella marina DSM 2698]SCZ43504.1 NAD(P)-dependent dehydrogenase, short-chain alcohol dehydrogenase family [Afifella marina DSM 2698]